MKGYMSLAIWLPAKRLSHTQKRHAASDTPFLYAALSLFSLVPSFAEVSFEFARSSSSSDP
jgi:hypothetical protein